MAKGHTVVRGKRPPRPPVPRGKLGRIGREKLLVLSVDELCKLSGLSRRHIGLLQQRERQRLGIAVAVEPQVVEPQVVEPQVVEPRALKPRFVDHPDLGKVSDNELSRRLGIPLSTINRTRRRLGIPPYGSSVPHDLPSAPLPPPPLPVSQESVCDHWGVGEIPWGLAYWCGRCSQWVLDLPGGEA